MQISKYSINGSSSNARRYAVLSVLVISAVIVYCCLGNLARPDIFALTPFCDAGGTCHERPEKSSPRTIYSSRSRGHYERWWEVNAALNKTAMWYAERSANMSKNDKERARPLILLGDSITESWMGTNMGVPADRAIGIPKVLENLLSKPPASHLNPLILAIAGDQTQHLLYRLAHGQLLPAFADDPTTIFVVLIGTNNIGSGELPDPTARGILEVADYILANSAGHLLLLQNLPRGDAFRLSRICPPRCDGKGQPFRSFLPAIEEVNKAVELGIYRLTERHGTSRIGLLDCGSEFYSDSDIEVDDDLMPDLLHPNAVGHKVLGECFMNYIHGLEKR